MAKLVDALDLGSSFERSEGSSPFTRTKNHNNDLGNMDFVSDCKVPLLLERLIHEDY